jgi:hypothetical protein
MELLKDGEILYVLRLYDENEVFYKLGRTKFSVRNRYAGNGLCYEFDIIYEKRHLNTRHFEYLYHKEHKDVKYTPKKKFVGYTECYLFNPLDDIEFETVERSLLRPGFETEYTRKLKHLEKRKEFIANAKSGDLTKGYRRSVIFEEIDIVRGTMSISSKYVNECVKDSCDESINDYMLKMYWKYKKLGKTDRSVSCLRETVEFLTYNNLKLSNDNIVEVSGLSQATVTRLKSKLK